MKKESSYAIIAIIIAVAVLAFYYFGGGGTGFAVSGDYTTEADCVTAGYAWENLTEQNCTDIPDCVVCEEDCVEDGENATFCEEGCVIEYTEILCEEGCQETCGANETECVECVEGCVEEYTEILCEEGCVLEEDLCEEDCQETCQTCEDIVVGGQCTGDVCDSDHLSLCDETDCVSVGGGAWYDDICNEDECEIDEHCADSFECIDNSCVEFWEDTETNDVDDVDDVDTVETAPVIRRLAANEISAISMNPGNSEEVEWSVRNTGNSGLTACRIKPLGDFVSWFGFSETGKNLDVGGWGAFMFEVAVPGEVEEGEYLVSVSVECAETAVSRDFTVNVAKKKLEFELLGADRVRKDRVRVIYSLQELALEDQTVEVYFSLLGVGGQEVGNAIANNSIGANETKEFRTNIEIDESLLPINETTNETLESELTLNTNFDSQIYSSSVQESVSIGAPVGGFAIFGEGGLGTGSIVLIVVVLAALIVIFFIVRKARLAKGSTK